MYAFVEAHEGSRVLKSYCRQSYFSFKLVLYFLDVCSTSLTFAIASTVFKEVGTWLTVTVFCTVVAVLRRRAIALCNMHLLVIKKLHEFVPAWFVGEFNVALYVLATSAWADFLLEYNVLCVAVFDKRSKLSLKRFVIVEDGVADSAMAAVRDRYRSGGHGKE